MIMASIILYKLTIRGLLQHYRTLTSDSRERKLSQIRRGILHSVAKGIRIIILQPRGDTFKRH